MLQYDSINFNKNIFTMNLGKGDYYAISSTGYKKHTNVEVIGVNSRQPYSQTKDLPTYFSQKDIKHQSVIKQEEEMEYETHEPQSAEANLTPNRLYNTSQLNDKEEVNSMYIDERSEMDRSHLIYSCIANNDSNKKTNLRKRLDMMQKNNVKSQSQDSMDDKNLYIELEKEKKLRVQLEKSYKDLLSQIQRNERYYQVDLNTELGDELLRKRQLSKRTLKQERSNDKLIQQDEERAPLSAKITKRSKQKTVKIRVPDLKDSSTPEKGVSSDEATPNEEEYQIEECQIENPAQETNHRQLNLRGTVFSQQSGGEEYEDYFTQQRQFQEKVLETVNHLTQKVEEIDNYLIEREHEREKEVLRRTITEKQNELKRIDRENQELKQSKELEKAEKKDAVAAQDCQLDFLHNISPNSLYFICILLMAVVAVA